ncbi:MAG: carbamoyltransferase HypF [Bacteroidales bacterium]|nr:carbamoyltransferase HypF [Bacteroidales bacterium]
MTSKKIHIKGLVQGVGFRPFIYRIAVKNYLSGTVDNRNDGVFIQIQGSKNDIKNFFSDLEKEAPPASSIDSVEVFEAEPLEIIGFEIVKSKNTSNEITDVSPDIAVCNDCLADMKTQANRINYPFINCTNCGPRFTIIKDLPYDREKTCMQPFIMCKDCNNEYSNILDRRFHAQPVACSVCGPKYSLIKENCEIEDFHEILCETTEIIDTGGIVAIKGMGGFFIACDAKNKEAVNRLRSSKERENKPFAVMFKNYESVAEYCNISEEEAKFLQSWRRPIVLLETKKSLASGVSMGFKTLGTMLPYMPVHYLLFEKVKTNCIVLTSGNISDEPILIDNSEAISKLKNIADAILLYNREIYNRNDDSVGFVINKKPRLIRRSRGFVPNPINLPFSVDGIIASGAELVNCFCVGKGNQAIISQHIGDLKNAATLEFYSEAINRFNKLFRVKPELFVCDLHPDYLSTRFAQNFGIEILQVQHHHAHIASCMAEHKISDKVIGLAMDGTGLGIDGNIWGGEFLLTDFSGFERERHFEYIAMPGGDKAAKQAWRMGLSYLYKAYGKEFLNLDIPFVRNLNEKDCSLLIQAIDKKINSPLTSSAGRLFDAVAAITNVCTNGTFHAEAPMRLESLAKENITENYPYGKGKEISFIPTIKAIVNDIKSNVETSVISAKFHNTFVKVILETIIEISAKTGIKKAVLSGGSFQNRYLLQKLENMLETSGIQVFSNEKIPANDAGIALGQLVIGAFFKNNNCKLH